ncbi:uncharacterized protein PAE49_004692 [Odontesthes bonariensis]|uniref:uncharacterized protein LOC142378461 n=1 Tax=Odontesthes bonariensis TaxID=219752 RepID=UPI003F58F3BA
MAFLTFLFLHFMTAQSIGGVDSETDLHFDCTNDYETMFCQLAAQNCSEYRLTLVDSYESKTKRCTFHHQCTTQQCCCSVQTVLVFGESQNATVWKGREAAQSKTIEVVGSFKPKTPTIVSVNESNGNFGVRWKTKYELSSIPLTAEVTHYEKKKKEEMVWKPVTPAIVDGLQYFEISGQHLEPSTTYMVRVRSVSRVNFKYSDSSEEWEFKTSPSVNSLVLAVGFVLSFASVIISAAIYGVYVRLQKKCKDNDSNPSVLKVHSLKEEMLVPEKSTPSAVFIQPLIPYDSRHTLKSSWTDSEGSGSLQHSSGISMGSSQLSYADIQPPNTLATFLDNPSKALPSISPEFLQAAKLAAISSPFNRSFVRTDQMSSGSNCSVNWSYSLLIPNSIDQMVVGISEIPMQTPMPCDLIYHPSGGDAVRVPEQQVPACLFPEQQDLSTVMPIDLSYQQCGADPQGFSYSEETSSSSFSSWNVKSASSELESRVEAPMGCERSDQLLSGSTKLTGESENPFYGCVPSESHGVLVVEDDYRPIESFMAPPDVLRSEERSCDQKKDLEKYQEESFNKFPQGSLKPFFQGFCNDAQRGASQLGLQTPFPTLISADNSMPIVTDSSYHRV